MDSYSEDGLDNFSKKKDLILIVLSMQRKIDRDNVDWLDEIRM